MKYQILGICFCTTTFVFKVQILTILYVIFYILYSIYSLFTLLVL